MCVVSAAAISAFCAVKAARRESRVVLSNMEIGVEIGCGPVGQTFKIDKAKTKTSCHSSYLIQGLELIIGESP